MLHLSFSHIDKILLYITSFQEEFRPQEIKYSIPLSKSQKHKIEYKSGNIYMKF